jgi:hypothetical protein
MRAIIRACLLAAAVVALGSVAGVGASPVGTGLGDAVVHDSAVEQAGYGSRYGHGSRYSYCEWMRRGCIYRESWGQIGETSCNCRRYRAHCGGGMTHCQQLRHTCIYGDGRWGHGEGSCRRFVRECSS